MTIEEIVRGESKNVEFKVKLPEDSAKYIKTIKALQGYYAIPGKERL